MAGNLERFNRSYHIIMIITRWGPLMAVGFFWSVIEEGTPGGIKNQTIFHLIICAQIPVAYDACMFVLTVRPLQQAPALTCAPHVNMSISSLFLTLLRYSDKSLELLQSLK